MIEATEIVTMLWQGLVWPLTRIVFFVSLGILVANFIEALNWTHTVAKLFLPLIRQGRLSDTVGASFSMAFFSGVAANTMLAEAHDQGRMSKLELVLANLFNSLPRFFLHLPTVFFLTAPFIKGAAFIYVGLTLSAATLQTALVVVAGRLLLAARSAGGMTKPKTDKEVIGWRQALDKSWKRFRKRIKKILCFTVPIYILFFILNRAGLFEWIEKLLSDHVPLLSWLHPKSLGIVVFHVGAEFAAGLAAAGALIESNSLGYRDVVLALMAGNILASPVRAVRHQFPYYAGIFKPRLALELIAVSQGFRIATTLLVTICYYLATR